MFVIHGYNNLKNRLLKLNFNDKLSNDTTKRYLI